MKDSILRVRVSLERAVVPELFAELSELSQGARRTRLLLYLHTGFLAMSRQQVADGPSLAEMRPPVDGGVSLVPPPSQDRQAQSVYESSEDFREAIAGMGRVSLD